MKVEGETVFCKYLRVPSIKHCHSVVDIQCHLSFIFQMAAVPVKTSVGCMEFGRQCAADQVWSKIHNL